jgi:hypothetical protein
MNTDNEDTKGTTIGEKTDAKERYLVQKNGSEVINIILLLEEIFKVVVVDSRSSRVSMRRQNP